MFFSIVVMLIFGFGANAQNKIEPVYNQDITFVANSRIDGAGVGFLLDLGRASRACKGFGVCEIVACWLVIYDGKMATPTSNQIITVTGGQKGSEHLTLELNNSLDPTKFDTNFYIDADLTSSGNEAVIKKGTYVLDRSIGKFGGYKIPVIVN